MMSLEATGPSMSKIWSTSTAGILRADSSSIKKKNKKNKLCVFEKMRLDYWDILPPAEDREDSSDSLADSFPSSFIYFFFWYIAEGGRRGGGEKGRECIK